MCTLWLSCCGGNTLLFILIFCLALVIWVDFKSVLLFIWGVSCVDGQLLLL